MVVMPVFHEPEKNGRGNYLRPLQKENVLASAKLAADVYSLSLDEWMAAGWRDFSIFSDGDIVPIRPESGTLRRLWDQLKLHSLKSKAIQHNPISQVRGLMGKHDLPSRAMVMIHPMTDGRHMVAVSFMGTGKRLQDWKPNFLMSRTDHAHQGFLLLAKRFEQECEKIFFPQTAKLLGMERLSLADILQEMKQPQSRFCLWMAGHSQGGAVMQLFTKSQMEQGVLPSHMLGIGFASPRVVDGLAIPPHATYPLQHIINREDLIPRIGSMAHLGTVYTYCGGAGDIRTACYHWSTEYTVLLRHLTPLVSSLKDSNDGMSYIAGICQFLSDYTDTDLREILGLMGIDKLPVQHLASAADERLDRLLTNFLWRIDTQCRNATGTGVNRRIRRRTAKVLRRCAEAYGFKQTMGTLLKIGFGPHHLTDGSDKYSYGWIAAHGLEWLFATRWQYGRNPRMIPVSTYQEANALVCRHACSRKRLERRGLTKIFHGEKARKGRRKEGCS